MFEYILVFTIIFVSTVYLVRQILHFFKGKAVCGCGSAAAQCPVVNKTGKGTESTKNCSMLDLSAKNQ